VVRPRVSGQATVIPRQVKILADNQQ
jgi:hypothetical protein